MRRYREQGFDLDLSYITPRIIAMADPGDDDGANRLSSIVNLLDCNHRGHFQIFNLSAGSSLYDPNVFNNAVMCFPIMEGSVPQFIDMVRFCESVDEFVESHPANVIVVSFLVCFAQIHTPIPLKTLCVSPPIIDVVVWFWFYHRSIPN